eukprot:6492756-Amphidinium_carterae.1
MFIICHGGFASFMKLFDATLGFPGEGPPFQQCMLCGLSGHNRRTCARASPYPIVPNTVVTDDVSMGGTEDRVYDGGGDPSTPMHLVQPAPATPTPVHIHPQVLDPGLPTTAIPGPEGSRWDGLAPQNLQMALDAEGEASSRTYCPVPGCLHNNPRASPGWLSSVGMRDHLQEHATGRLQGDIPLSYMEDQRLSQCSVCHRLIASRFGLACPRCRPALVDGPRLEERVVPMDYPSIENVMMTHITTRKYVPEGCKLLWAQALVGCLSQVVYHGDTLAWLDLLMLPKCCLRVSDRGGKDHRKRHENETKLRLRRWLEGERGALWEMPTRRKRKKGTLAHDEVAE